VETGRNGAIVADTMIVISVSRVDKYIDEIRSEILFRTLCPTHGEVLLAEGRSRIHAPDVEIEVEISHSVIQSIRDHGVWCGQVTRGAHNGVAKVHACGDNNMENGTILMEEGTTILLFEDMQLGTSQNE
jgi:hypothetical protein